MSAPCSVKTRGGFLRPPRPLFDITFCDFKFVSSSRLNHQFSHFKGMGIPQMPVSLGDQQAPVFMTDPRGDGFKVDSFHDGVTDKVMPHAVMGEVGQRRA